MLINSNLTSIIKQHSWEPSMNESQCTNSIDPGPRQIDTQFTDTHILLNTLSYRNITWIFTYFAHYTDIKLLLTPAYKYLTLSNNWPKYSALNTLILPLTQTTHILLINSYFTHMHFIHTSLILFSSIVHDYSTDILHCSWFPHLNIIF